MLCFGFWVGFSALVALFVGSNSGMICMTITPPNKTSVVSGVSAGRSSVPPAFHFRLRQTSAGQVGATGAVHVPSRRWLSYFR